jgi:hypothetical protein
MQQMISSSFFTAIRSLVGAVSLSRPSACEGVQNDGAPAPSGPGALLQKVLVRTRSVYQVLVGQPLLPATWVHVRVIAPVSPREIVNVSPLVDLAVTV